MALVAARCTQCGASIEVDDTREAGICTHCGTAFITEIAISKSNKNPKTMTYNTAHRHCEGAQATAAIQI